jgi:hypothetical protein
LQSHITDSPRLCAQIQFSRVRHFPLKVLENPLSHSAAVKKEGKNLIGFPFFRPVSRRNLFSLGAAGR